MKKVLLTFAKGILAVGLLMAVFAGIGLLASIPGLLLGHSFADSFFCGSLVLVSVGIVYNAGLMFSGDKKKAEPDPSL